MPWMDRRILVKILAVGAADLAAGCAHNHPMGISSVAVPSAAAPQPASQPVRAVPDAPTPPSPPAASSAVPEPQQILFNAPAAARQVALTIDDGFNPAAVAGYINFASRTNIPLSFAPNGMYHAVWDQHAAAVRHLIESGRVTMINHTWSHRSIRTLSDAALRADVERNDDWIERTFGVTTRPWFRPPYGEHNGRSRAILAELGYSRILMWSGSVGDSRLGVTAGELVTAARRSLQPGAVVLGHANQRVVVNLYGELERLIAQRALVPVTVGTMFPTGQAGHGSAG
jgi:peptidoglycan/xylan/chitin deacetylase (PgdA/CDA1 family)